MRRCLARLFVAVALVSSVAALQAQSPLLLVLNKEENSLAIIDPAARKVLGTVPTGEAPHEVAASSDGKLAFVANYGAHTPGNTLSVVDIDARKELRRVDLGAMHRPHGLAFAAGKLYFTAEDSKLIGRYDPDANRIDWLMGTGQNGTHMLVITRDLSRIFASNIGSNTVSAIERNGGNWKETAISVGKGPEGIDLSPDEKEVWSAGSQDGSIWIIDAATNKTTANFNIHTKRSNRLKFTPDGDTVLVSDLSGGELVFIDARRHTEVKRLKTGAGTEGILIVPDGSRAYVAVAGNNEVDEIDLKTQEIANRIPTGRGPDGMAWVVSAQAGTGASTRNRS